MCRKNLDISAFWVRFGPRLGVSRGPVGASSTQVGYGRFTVGAEDSVSRVEAAFLEACELAQETRSIAGSPAGRRAAGHGPGVALRLCRRLGAPPHRAGANGNAGAAAAGRAVAAAGGVWGWEAEARGA